jgi:putative MATE family efflux protein
MLTRERVGTIGKLSIPIGIGLSSNLIMAMVDLAMIRPLGNHATAAVGLSVFCQSLIVAFVAGLGPVVQGAVARRRGQGSTEPVCLPLNAGLLMALIIGIPLTVLGYFGAPVLFSLLSDDPAVIRTGVPFLRTLYAVVIAIGMNVAFKGFWAGMEKPKVFMAIVVFINCLNFFGNFVLITGRFGAPALGATGAALSTAFSVCVGVVINFTLVWRRYRPEGFLRARPTKKLLTRIFQLGVPATVQEFVFALGFVVLFWLVGQIGTAEVAALNVMIRISFVLSILSLALGSTSATLVSKTLGQGDPEGAAQWGWDVAKLGVVVITLIGLPFVLFPRFFLSLFLSNPHTIAIAVIPWQVAAGLAGVASLTYVFAYTLISVGDAARVAIVSFGTQWLFFLPAVWFVGPYLHYGLLEVTYVQVVYGAVSTALITAIWAQGRWKKVHI